MIIHCSNTDGQGTGYEFQNLQNQTHYPFSTYINDLKTLVLFFFFCPLQLQTAIWKFWNEHVDRLRKWQTTLDHQYMEY